MKLRAYSFCAVFLFRFINRNRRVQKERLSFERNNFHGNKMAHCLISNWKGKKVRKHYTKTKFERKIRATFSTDSLSRLSSTTPLSSSFFLVSLRTRIHAWLPARNGELLLCWQLSFSKGKAVRKMRNKTRNSLLCFPTYGWGGTSTKASAQKIVFQTAHEDKERNENIDAPA